MQITRPTPRQPGQAQDSFLQGVPVSDTGWSDDTDESREIDLREVKSAFLAQWEIVLLSVFVSLVLSIYYAMNFVEPIYQAETVFAPPKSEGGGLVPGLEGLAALGVAPGGDGKADFIAEKIDGFDFIAELSDQLSLHEDPYFNTTLRPPGIPTRFLRWSGLAAQPGEVTQEKVMDRVVRSFRRNVGLGETDNKAYTIVVAHTDRVVAATIANAIVDKVLAEKREKEIEDQRVRVQYLSEELFKAQEDLDAASEKVREFAVANNMLSQQDLVLQSQKLVRMRDRDTELMDSIAGLRALNEILRSGSRDEAQIDQLRDRYSGLNNRDVLLLLGQPTTAADWFALDANQIEARIRGLERSSDEIQRSITEFEREVTATAESATELARLERRVTVLGATYEVLVEQFKKESLLSGMDVSTGEVFQTARPPIFPTKPNVMNAGVAGIVTGLLIAVLVVLRISRSRSTYYAKESVERFFRGRSEIFSRAILGYANRLPRLPGGLFGGRQTSEEVENFKFAVNQSQRPVMVIPSSRREAPSMARFAAAHLSAQERSVVIVDFFHQMKKAGAPEDATIMTEFYVWNASDKVSVAQPTDTVLQHMASLVTEPAFMDNLSALIGSFDRAVLLVPTPPRGNYMPEALQFLRPVPLVSFQLGRSRQQMLQHVASKTVDTGRNDNYLVIC